MSVSIARSRLERAQKDLESARQKQADAEKKAAGYDKDAAAKERRAQSASSATTRDGSRRDASKKRDDAATARSQAARHSEDVAKAQRKVHEAQADLRKEEQREADRDASKRQAADRKAAADRTRADRARDATHQREVRTLRSRIDEQDALLAARPWHVVPETITVLFISASPEDQDSLRIDREMREIQQRVRAAEHRDALKFAFAVAAQPADLLQQLNEHKPDIVHFSGHSDSAGLALEDDDGRTRLLSTQDLATLVSVSSRRIRLAVFNSCESAEQAAAATRHLNAAIGMDEEIDDEAAKVFAGQLYSAIAFGLPLSTAFEQALVQVRLVLGEDSGEPRLHVADGVDSSQLVLVQPQSAAT